RAEAGILALDAQLDRLGRKNGAGGGGLLPGLGGLVSSSGGALGGAGPYAPAGAGVLGAALGPAAAPPLLGGGLGAIGAYLAMGGQLGKIFSQAFDEIKSAVAPLRPLFAAVFTPLPGFVRSIGPQLRDMFKATVPFLRLFVQFGEQAAKLVLPV